MPTQATCLLDHYEITRPKNHIVPAPKKLTFVVIESNTRSTKHLHIFKRLMPCFHLKQNGKGLFQMHLKSEQRKEPRRYLKQPLPIQTHYGDPSFPFERHIAVNVCFPFFGNKLYASAFNLRTSADFFLAAQLGCRIPFAAA